jgi:predicted ArsR family transcriptional regulator
MSSSTRELILRTLKSQGKCTVNELALAAEISPVSVRHHLANLQADGLVSVKEMKHGVGRPHHVFSLTEKAIELSPGRYFRLTNRLLDEIKDSLPDAMVAELFSKVATSMSEQYSLELQGLSLDQKLKRLIQLLSEEGFEAHVEQQGDMLLIHELSCPYFHIGREHPEVCLVDHRFIAKALGLPVERVTHVLDGAPHCIYAINLQDKTLEVSIDE